MMSNLFWNEGRGEFQSAFSDTDFPFAKVATVAHTSVVSVSVVNSTRLVVAHILVAFAANRHSATAVEEMTAVLHLWDTLLLVFFLFFPFFPARRANYITIKGANAINPVFAFWFCFTARRAFKLTIIFFFGS